MEKKSVNLGKMWLCYGWRHGGSNKGKISDTAENTLALLHLSHVIWCVSHSGVRASQGQWGRLWRHLFFLPSFQTRCFRIQIPFCGGWSTEHWVTAKAVGEGWVHSPACAMTPSLHFYVIEQRSREETRTVEVALPSLVKLNSRSHFTV